MSKAEEFRKQYLGLEKYNHTATLTGFAIDEMMESYHQSRVSAITDEINIQIKIGKDLASPKNEIEILEWFKQKLTNKE